MAQRIARGAERAKNAVGSKVTAADVWIQDHHKAVVISMLTGLGAGTGALLWWRWAEVIDIAKQVAPVLTVVSIVATAVLSVLQWFSKRRKKRLAEEAERAEAEAKKSEAEAEEAEALRTDVSNEPPPAADPTSPKADDAA
ncbi:hypothetical protein P1P68_12105 [Streptomyces scabiei]|uniref:hypothetical protein n=1 Tax=Streptomyces scabiei TaxID=1930 RepID=UPI0029904B34|nr:hypothetical protein [Streptomyces scabiei]MDW8805500.1 hypothetical protein [Streptomyces scabiei]